MHGTPVAGAAFTNPDQPNFTACGVRKPDSRVAVVIE